ncbi:MAG: hypothetical protein FWC20_06395 [Oscillospiraceae bacterium]|nr:hypothetical protein [Oscillospiraceae bacterium]MCL2279022.1 hypothetical protein [Oscillospiraceae bacterium]
MHEGLSGNNKPDSDNLIAYLFALTAALFLLIARFALFYYQSHDYIQFLSVWVNEYRGMSFWEALGTNVGNYNPPYMYLLNIIARIDFSDLYLIKAVSVIFDFLLAYFAMKIVSLRTESVNIRIFAFIATLAIPTVLLNSAMWGQCDSIYSAFALGALYFSLRGKSKTAYAFMALALGFKLQAAFLFPIFIVCILTNKIRFRDCYMFFAVYLALMLPAIIAGMPLSDSLFMYLTQVDSFHFITLNAMNIWQLVGHVYFPAFRIVGFAICALAVLSLLYFAFVHRERFLHTADYVRLAFVFAAVAPFLLPQMHDRFFYMADVLSLLVFFYDKRRWYVPVITIFCSYVAYVFFLMNWEILIEFRFLAIAMGLVIILVLRDLVLSMKNNTEVLINDTI